MKNHLLCLLLIAAISQFGYAQSVDQLLKKVENIENIEKVKMGSFTMGLCKIFGNTKDIPIAKGISSIEVYSLSSCPSSIKNDLAKLFKNIKDGDGYETLIYAKDKGEGVRIMMKKKKDTITDLVILCMENEESAIIRISGKIAEKDIAELTYKYEK